MPATPFVYDIFPQPYQILLPSPAQNLVTFQNPNAGFETFTRVSFPFGIYIPLKIAPQRIALLYQAWLMTAGKTAYQYLTLNYESSGEDSRRVDGRILRRIRFTFDKPIPPGPRHGLNPGSGVYGTFRWVRGLDQGPLQYLNFQQTFLDPPFFPADAAQWTIAPGYSAKVDFFEMDANIPGIQWGSTFSSGCNPYTNRFDREDILSGGLPAIITDTTTSSDTAVPVNNITYHEPEHFDHSFGPIGIVSSAGWRQLEKALINDIWAYTVAQHLYTKTDLFNVNGTSQIWTPSMGGFVKHAALIVTGLIKDPPTFYRNPTFPVLGCWAPAVNGFIGQLQYVNNRQCMLWPLPWDCTGIWLGLGNVATAELELGSTEAVNQDTITDNGIINLLAGLNTALLYSH